MKKIVSLVLVTCFCCLIPTVSFAQSLPTPPLEVTKEEYQQIKVR